MIRLIARMFGRRPAPVERIYGPGSPIFEGRQLVTEAKLRQYVSEGILADAMRAPPMPRNGNRVEQALMGGRDR